MNHNHRKRYQKKHQPLSVPVPLSRAPDTNLVARIDDLDQRTSLAIDALCSLIDKKVDSSSSLDELRLLTTKSHLLLAMKGTHRSIGKLVYSDDDESLDVAVDALPLTRMQLERCFLALLIEDKPGRWYKRYRKNAWKAFAEKFFRDQKCLGLLEPFKEHFGSGGSGISVLRAFAREMDVWEDELQTLRAMVLGEEMDSRWDRRFIADMPTPGKAIELLSDPKRKKLAEILYPYYDNLSHFSHGGMAGVMEAAILRGDPVAAAPDTKIKRDEFFRTSVIEQTLPLSYIATLFVTTLFATQGLADDETIEKLVLAWRPYHSDGSALGINLWDYWVSDTLEASLKTNVA